MVKARVLIVGGKFVAGYYPVPLVTVRLRSLSLSVVEGRAGSSLVILTLSAAKGKNPFIPAQGKLSEGSAPKISIKCFVLSHLWSARDAHFRTSRCRKAI